MTPPHAPRRRLAHARPDHGRRRPDERRSARRRRGVAAIAMVVLLLVLQLIVVSQVLGTARDQDLTARRLETVQAFYASEAGMNMAIRELVEGADEDGDGTTGTISDDGNDGNDPALGTAQVVVTQSSGAGSTTLTSQGRSGSARRTIRAVAQ